MRWFLTLLLLAPLAVPAEAQNTPPSPPPRPPQRVQRGQSPMQETSQAGSFRLADQYLRAGQADRAIALLEDLYAEQPSEAVYAKLRQAYEADRRFDDVVTLIERRLRDDGRSVALLADLGSAQFNAGHTDAARVTWSDALALAPDAEMTYRLVANQQGQLRLFNATTDVLNAWTPQNTNTDVPRSISGDPNQNSRTSDRFIEDGSYLRLKNLSIGYTIPAAVLSKATKGYVNRLRIYASSQNLLTFTGYSGYDPEIASKNGNLLNNGIDYAQYPQARTLLVGINLGF